MWTTLRPYYDRATRTLNALAQIFCRATHRAADVLTSQQNEKSRRGAHTGVKEGENTLFSRLGLTNFIATQSPSSSAYGRDLISPTATYVGLLLNNDDVAFEKHVESDEE